MPHHACFSLPIPSLDVVVIDDSKPMQAIVRSMLHAMHVRRIRVYDGFKDAVTGMLRDAPNLIILDWRIGRTTGHRFLRTLRKRQMGSLGLVPVVVITAHATGTMLERAMSAGAHSVLVKPLSPSVLYDRINWLVADGRRFLPGPGDSLVIEGMADRLRLLSARLGIPPAPQRDDPPLRLPPPEPGREKPALGFAETVKPRTGPKLPAETLKRMPRLNHFAALRGPD